MRTKNPLHDYRTYAYHHILIIARNTSIIEEFKNNTISLSNLLHQSTENRRTVQNSPSGESYFVLVNTMSDMDFIIDDVQWENLMIPSASSVGGSDRITTMSISGSMKVIEPFGIRFMNEIQKAHNQLGTDPSGSVFLLKTIFVGYPSDGGPPRYLQQDYNGINIVPLGFTPTSIEAEITAAGTEYNITFVSINNGVAKNPAVANAIAGNVSAIVPSAQQGSSNNASGSSSAPTLREVFDQLQIKLLDNYEQYKKQVQDLLPNPNPFPFRPVSYQFVLHSDYNENYMIDNLQSHMAQDKGTNDPIINFSPKMTIEQCINHIMSLSTKVQEDSNGGPEGIDDRYLHKILTTVKSTDKEYTIVYKIERYKEPAVKSENVNSLSADNAQPGDILELDYMYTGQNLDIIDFNIKMSMGLVLFQTLRNQSNAINIQQEIANTTISPNKVCESSSPLYLNGQQRPFTPLPLSSPPNDPRIMHNTNPVSAMSYKSLLAKHAAIEALQTQVTIHGNPILLNDLSVSPDEIISDATPTRLSDKSINRSWMSQPGFAKINIEMPKTNSISYNTKYDHFWFNGLYKIMKVENKFEGGLFTQTLHMLSLPQTGDVKNQLDTELDLSEIGLSTTLFPLINPTSNEFIQQQNEILNNPDAPSTLITGNIS